MTRQEKIEIISANLEMSLNSEKQFRYESLKTLCSASQ